MSGLAFIRAALCSGVLSDREVSAGNTAKRVGESARGCRPARPASRQQHRRERCHGRRRARARRRRGAGAETLPSNAILHLAGAAPRERMFLRDHRNAGANRNGYT